MCLQDVRIGRASPSTQQNVSAGVAAGPLVSAACDRTCMIVDNLGPQDVFITFEGTPSATNGQRIAMSDPPHKIDIRHYGDAVGKAWQCIAPAGVSNVNVIEVFYKDADAWNLP